MGTVADIRLAQGRTAEALALFDESNVMMTAATSADSLERAYSLTGIGEANVRLGRAREALEPLEKALKIREGRETLPVEIGKTRSALARALKASGGDSLRAATLAEQARADLEGAGRKGAQELAALDAAFPAM